MKRKREDALRLRICAIRSDEMGLVAFGDRKLTFRPHEPATYELEWHAASDTKLDILFELVNDDATTTLWGRPCLSIYGKDGYTRLATSGFPSYVANAVRCAASVTLAPGLRQFGAALVGGRSGVRTVVEPVSVTVHTKKRLRWVAHPERLVERQHFILCWQVSARQENPLWVLPLEAVHRIVYYINWD